MFKFWHDAAMLSLEAQRVIALRMMKLAQGGKRAPRRSQPDGHGEDRRIRWRAAATLMSGGSGEAVMAQVRRRVRSNSRRLSRS